MSVSTRIRAFCFAHLNTRRAAFLAVCWLYACIHLDRQILGILAESVKSALQLTDQQLGALTGSAFALVYALLGLYFGGLADRSDRLLLVRSGAWVWSLSCIAGAFATGYPFLVLCRAGVAVGEAVAAAAAVSLIGDLAGERYRGRLAGLFLTAAFVGAGAAAILGGAVVEHFRSSSVVAGWRAALVAAGIPGVLGAACLSFFAYQPPRRGAASKTVGPLLGAALVIVAPASVAVQMLLPPLYSVPLCLAGAAATAWWWGACLRRRDPPSFAATLGQKAFRYFVFAFAAVMFVDYAAAFWLIPFAQRRFGVGAGVVGAQLGGLIVVAGIIGCMAGGWVADRWRGIRAGGRVWTALAAVLLEGAAIVAAVAQTDYRMFTVAFTIFCFASGAWTAVAAATGFDIVPAEQRGTGTAAYFLVTTIVGPGLGPLVVGIGSDAFGPLGVGAMLGWACMALLIAGKALIDLGLLLENGQRGQLPAR